MPTNDSNASAKRLIAEGIVPAMAVLDAMHLVIAATDGSCLRYDGERDARYLHT